MKSEIFLIRASSPSSPAFVISLYPLSISPIAVCYLPWHLGLKMNHRIPVIDGIELNFEKVA